jgi:hypothetical protein
MGYLGSPQHIIEMLANYVRATITGRSEIDNSETRIDAQRRIVELIVFLIVIGLPAAFILLWSYFPDFARGLSRW